MLKNKISIKLLALLFFTSALFSCQTLFNRSSDYNRNPAQTAGQHFIVTIHGIAGDETTFGEMENVLVGHLQKLQPEKQYKYLKFQYPSGKDDKNTFDFSYKYLSSFLREKIGTISPNDKITFICHSQGGLVSSIWYMGAVLGVDQNGLPDSNIALDKSYALATDKIITIGTPFWGSKLATMATDKESLASAFGQLVGYKELKEMAFLSNTIYSFRKTAIALTSDPEYQKVHKPKFINISGVYPRDLDKLFYPDRLVSIDKSYNLSRRLTRAIHNVFRSRSFSSEKLDSGEVDRSESDVAVIVPSGRSEFYHSSAILKCNQENKVEYSSFKKANVMGEPEYILTESIHAPLGSKKSVAMATIPSFCSNPSDCLHPAYRYILKNVANCETDQCNRVAQEDILAKMDEINRNESNYNSLLSSGADLQGFSIEINLKVPENYDLPIEFYYSKSNGIGEIPDQEWIMRQKEVVRKLVHLRSDLIPQDQNSVFEFKLSRKSEYYSALAEWKNVTFRKKTSTDLGIHITGILKVRPGLAGVAEQVRISKILSEGAVLPLEIKLPSSLKIKSVGAIVNAKIKPGFSTFVELDYRSANDCN